MSSPYEDYMLEKEAIAYDIMTAAQSAGHMGQYAKAWLGAGSKGRAAAAGIARGRGRATDPRIAEQMRSMMGDMGRTPMGAKSVDLEDGTFGAPAASGNPARHTIMGAGYGKNPTIRAGAPRPSLMGQYEDKAKGMRTTQAGTQGQTNVLRDPRQNTIAMSQPAHPHAGFDGSPIDGSNLGSSEAAFNQARDAAHLANNPGSVPNLGPMGRRAPSPGVNGYHAAAAAGVGAAGLGAYGLYRGAKALHGAITGGGEALASMARGAAPYAAGAAAVGAGSAAAGGYGLYRGAKALAGRFGGAAPEAEAAAQAAATGGGAARPAFSNAHLAALATGGTLAAVAGANAMAGMTAPRHRQQ
jgi:hypothetical protein